MIALVAWPALATAPSVQTGDIPSSMDNYVVASYVQKLPPKPVPYFSKSSCVSYVKHKRPDLNEVWITPKKYAETHTLSKVPTVGAVGISREGPVWHAWYVEAVASGSIELSECNYISGKCGTRILPVDSQLIVGYEPL